MATLKNRKRHLVVVVAGAVAATAAAVSVAVSGAGGAGPTGIPEPVADMAIGQRVTGLRAVVVNSARSLGVYTGIDSSGASMIAVGSEDASTPFAPMARVFAKDDLVIFPQSGGSSGSVSWSSVAGVVSKNVSRVEIVRNNGNVSPVALVGQGFTFSATLPNSFPSKVVAYDAAGRVLGTRVVPTPQPPAE